MVYVYNEQLELLIMDIKTSPKYKSLTKNNACSDCRQLRPCPVIAGDAASIYPQLPHRAPSSGVPTSAWLDPLTWDFWVA